MAVALCPFLPWAHSGSWECVGSSSGWILEKLDSFIWKLLLKEVHACIRQNPIPGTIGSYSSSFFSNRESRVKTLFQSIDSMFWQLPQRVVGRGFNPINGLVISNRVTIEMTAASQNFGLLAHKMRMEIHFLYLLDTQCHPHPHTT